jgi:prepilin-type N-terminal cleavage/methylation domain-containing protein
MKHRQIRQDQKGLQALRGSSACGFTLLELIFVIIIGLIMTVIALPLVNNGMNSYRLNGAVGSITGTLQSTRYLAIFNGYPFQVTFNNGTMTSQVLSDPNRTGTFTNYCTSGAASCSIPMGGSGTPIALGATTTFTFSPGGTVQSTTAVAGVTNMVITYSGKTETITVSSYGNVKVTP